MRIVLVLSIIDGCITHQVDLVLSFPQANIYFDIYMEITQGIETKGGIRTKHVLNILKNLYGHRQGYIVWKQHLAKEP